MYLLHIKKNNDFPSPILENLDKKLHSPSQIGAYLDEDVDIQEATTFPEFNKSINALETRLHGVKINEETEIHGIEEIMKMFEGTNMEQQVPELRLVRKILDFYYEHLDSITEDNYEGSFGESNIPQLEEIASAIRQDDLSRLAQIMTIPYALYEHFGKESLDESTTLSFASVNFGKAREEQDDSNFYRQNVQLLPEYIAKQYIQAQIIVLELTQQRPTPEIVFRHIKCLSKVGILSLAKRDNFLQSGKTWDPILGCIHYCVNPFDGYSGTKIPEKQLPFGFYSEPTTPYALKETVSYYTIQSILQIFNMTSNYSKAKIDVLKKLYSMWHLKKITDTKMGSNLTSFVSWVNDLIIDKDKKEKYDKWVSGESNVNSFESDTSFECFLCFLTYLRQFDE